MKTRNAFLKLGLQHRKWLNRVAIRLSFPRQVKKDEKRIRKGLVITGIVALLLTIPLAGAAIPTIKTIPTSNENLTTCMIIVGREKVKTQLPLSEVKDFVNYAATFEDDFMTIYNKRASNEEVAVAFDNLQPFFQRLGDEKFTSKNVSELTAFFNSIRERVREPRKDNRAPPANSLGFWNGVPTPIWGNTMCGLFEVGECIGFIAGTHTLIPTIGADLFATYCYSGIAKSVGLGGGTTSALGFEVWVGFVGVILCTPGIMIGPYFLTGLCGGFVAIGM